VYVVWSEGWQSQDPLVPSDIPEYDCSWQNHEDPEDTDIFDGAKFATLDAALVWARRRSDVILVDPEWKPHTYLRATDAPPNEWPAAEPPESDL
jgi:hypothetical protein